jgi:hypothetical protein
VAEPLAGTATAAAFLLAVEQSGPYAGREAATGSAMPAELGRRLAAEVASRGGKLLLIRRPEAHPVVDHAARRVFLSLADGQRTTTLTARLADPLEALGWLAAPPPSTRALTHPVLLVCTHGRRDLCCARAGRDLLRTPTPWEVWESSHQGGHRFAPSVWELTTGYQHGRVSPQHLDSIGAMAAQGRIHLATARGHFAMEQSAQAADLAVRRTAGITEQAGLRVGPGEGVDHVATDGAGRHWTAEVSRRPLGPRVASCGADPVAGEAFDVRVVPD